MNNEKQLEELWQWFLGYERIFDDILDLIPEATWEKIDAVEDDFKDIYCELRGNHTWVNDQCGFWQHQMCVYYNRAKYPDLAIKSCKELRNEMGTLTEKEYNEGLH